MSDSHNNMFDNIPEYDSFSDSNYSADLESIDYDVVSDPLQNYVPNHEEVVQGVERSVKKVFVDPYAHIRNLLEELIVAINRNDYSTHEVEKLLKKLPEQFDDMTRQLAAHIVQIIQHVNKPRDAADAHLKAEIEKMGQQNEAMSRQNESMSQQNAKMMAAIARLQAIVEGGEIAVSGKTVVDRDAYLSSDLKAEMDAELDAKSEEIATLKLREEALNKRETEVQKLEADVQKREADMQKRVAALTASFTKRYRTLVAELAAAKGNIRVLCRIKPEEAPEEDMVSFTDPSLDTQSFLPWSKLRATYENDSKKPEERDFRFQRVFGGGENNESIFDEVKDVAKSAIFGQACTIMAYGATGTGKSYTFLSEDGLVQRYIGLLFSLAEEERSQYEYEFHLSAVEIYLNKIYDLLQTVSEDGEEQKKAEVKLNTESSVMLESHDAAAALIRDTIDRREAASTKQNATSSRSHFILALRIVKKPIGKSSNEKPTDGIIHFIDLAGSEAAGKNLLAAGKADPSQTLIYEQGQDINKSLLDLGQGVRNLAMKGKFFPGHNLTRALRSSLTHGSRLLLIVTVSPLKTNQGNTLNTLKWSQEAIGRVRSAGPAAGENSTAPAAGSNKSPGAPATATVAARVAPGKIRTVSLAGSSKAPTTQSTLASKRASISKQGSSGSSLRPSNSKASLKPGKTDM